MAVVCGYVYLSIDVFKDETAILGLACLRVFGIVGYSASLLTL